MKKAIGAVVGFGALLAWKFYGGSLVVSAESAAGKGWDDARPELVQTYTKAYTENLSGIDLNASVKSKMANCAADKAISFLNDTDCRYKYNEATTSESEHLAEQEKCMERVAFSKEEERIDFECTREHFPDDWTTFAPLLKTELLDGLTQGGMGAADAEKMASCILGKLVTMLNKSTCRVINRDAKPDGKLFNTFDECMEDEALKAGYEASLQACGPNKGSAIGSE